MREEPLNIFSAGIDDALVHIEPNEVFHGLTKIGRISAVTSARQVRFTPHPWGSAVLFAASIHAAMASPYCHILEVSLGLTLRVDALDRFKYVEGPEYSF
jgi:L-alanine-DL-glutamate epimerase-like enolase superfamily enzyme